MLPITDGLLIRLSVIEIRTIIPAIMTVEISPSSRTDAAKVGRQKNALRSRITNGRDVLPDVDGRSLIARRYRDISSAIIVDQGGADQCSESRLQLIRRFAAAAVLAEQLESRLANGEQIDVQEHATLSSVLVRLATKIGVDRVPRDISGPTLSDLVRWDDEEQRQEEAAEAAEAAAGSGQPDAETRANDDDGG
jgi:hypothetical protein